MLTPCYVKWSPTLLLIHFTGGKSNLKTFNLFKKTISTFKHYHSILTVKKYMVPKFWNLENGKEISKAMNSLCNVSLFLYIGFYTQIYHILRRLNWQIAIICKVTETVSRSAYSICFRTLLQIYRYVLMHCVKTTWIDEIDLNKTYQKFALFNCSIYKAASLKGVICKSPREGNILPAKIKM